ncbi:hypothetical protein HDU67_008522 [Dinochytrium kinnereticum]|nr:hypothetical protein HDU67_008522 [Dinochytrium kinnereticum]
MPAPRPDQGYAPPQQLVPTAGQGFHDQGRRPLNQGMQIAQPQRPVQPAGAQPVNFFGQAQGAYPPAANEAPVSLPGAYRMDGKAAGTAPSTWNKLGSKKTVFEKLIPQEEKDSKVTWSKTTLFSMIVMSLILFGLQSVVIQRQTQLFNQYKENIPESIRLQNSDELFTNIKANLVYSSSFYLAIIFGVFTTWDSILQQNLIQVLAIVAYNFGMFVFTIIQYSQFQNTLLDLDEWDIPESSKSVLRIVQILLILVTLIWFLVAAFFAYRLYYEFTWRIYRRIGGDIKLEADYQNYHIYMLCIKYSIFFSTIFLIMILVMGQSTTLVIGLTVVIGIPLAIAMIFFAFYGARKESRGYLTGAFASALILLAYDVARLVQMYNKEVASQYSRIRLPATFFGAMAVVLLIGALIYTFVCAGAFVGGGLKHLLAQNRKNAPPLPELNLDE